MAKRLEEIENIPEVIYSSPANRAFHTAIIMARVWNLKDSNIHITSKLYLPSVDNIISLIFELPDDETSIAIFGHNPGFVDFANRFVEEPIENLPTAGVAVITMEIESWSDIIDCKINDVYIDCPKKNKK